MKTVVLWKVQSSTRNLVCPPILISQRDDDQIQSGDLMEKLQKMLLWNCHDYSFDVYLETWITQVFKTSVDAALLANPKPESSWCWRFFVHLKVLVPS